MKRCDHKLELEADPEGKPATRTIRRIEMTVEREVISVVRRTAASGSASVNLAHAGVAVCEHCGQPLPAITPALPAETIIDAEPSPGDEAERK
jgi:hypothetical protein